MKQCRDREGKFQAHEWGAIHCSQWGLVTMRCHECDQRHEVWVDYIDNRGGPEFKGGIWENRECIEPPYEGYEMFADSCPVENVPHLISEGVKPEDITIVDMEQGSTIWRVKE